MGDSGVNMDRSWFTSFRKKYPVSISLKLIPLKLTPKPGDNFVPIQPEFSWQDSNAVPWDKNVLQLRLVNKT